MIRDTLTMLEQQLNRRYPPVNGQAFISLGNIAGAEGGAEGGGNLVQELDGLVLSLVNVTEDASLKNGPQHRVEAGRTVSYNRPIHLYLYLLFSAAHKNYPAALLALSRVIEFFQEENVFDAKNIDLQLLRKISEAPQEFRLVVELQSLSFEQVNHLWGSLGGKQVPFALYRGRLVAVTARQERNQGPIITETDLQAASGAP